jgi:hypothetical protein
MESVLITRNATPDDALAVATVHVRAWQEGYRGLVDDAYLDALRPEDRAARYDLAASDPACPSTIVAVADGVVCGFASVGPCRDADAHTGQLLALHVDRSRRPARGYTRSASPKPYSGCSSATIARNAFTE